ncbi:MAG TPA: hypothetical protein VIL69_14755 [Roseomonas sp.]
MPWRLRSPRGHGLPLLLAVLAAALALRYGLYIAAAQPIGLVQAFCRWDCGWYITVAELGYQPTPSPDGLETANRSNWAFFPAFPWLFGSIARLTGMTYALAATVVNLALLPVLILLATLWFTRTRQARSGWGMPLELVIFLCVWPWGLYFSIPYTETLFAVLMLATLLLLRGGHWLPAALTAMGLCATRPTGIVVTAIAMLAVLIPALTGLLKARTPEARKEASLSFLQGAAFGAVGALGLAGYMFFLHGRVGDALAFQHVQLAWGRSLENPLTLLFDGLAANDLGNLFREPAQAMSDTYLAIAGIAALLICGWLAWARRWLETAICLTTLLIPLSTGLLSIPRFAFTNPLIILAVWDMVRRLPLPWRGGIYLALGAAQAWLLRLWFHEAFGVA